MNLTKSGEKLKLSYIADERIDEFAKAFVAFLRRILAERHASQDKLSNEKKSSNAKKSSAR